MTDYPALFEDDARQRARHAANMRQASARERHALALEALRERDRQRANAVTYALCALVALPLFGGLLWLVVDAVRGCVR